MSCILFDWKEKGYRNFQVILRSNQESSGWSQYYSRTPPGIQEKLNNPDFNPVKFEGCRNGPACHRNPTRHGSDYPTRCYRKVNPISRRRISFSDVRQIDKTGVFFIFPHDCLFGKRSACQKRLLARILFFDGENSIRARIGLEKNLIVPFFGNKASLGRVWPGSRERSPSENEVYGSSSSRRDFAGMFSDVKSPSPS